MAPVDRPDDWKSSAVYLAGLVKAIGGAHHQLGMEQAEVGEGVLGLLVGGVAEQAGQIGVAELLGHIGKEEVFAVGHALAAEGGLEVRLGGGIGEVHGGGCVLAGS